jgi:hypothetical protein
MRPVFARVGPRHRKSRSTSIMDVRAGRLLDVFLSRQRRAVPGGQAKLSGLTPARLTADRRA